MSRFSRNFTVLFFGAIFCLWYAFFVWEGIPDEKKCFSPNHEFYFIKVYPLTALITSKELWTDVGIIKVFNKHNELIISSEAPFDNQAGPYWSEHWDIKGNPDHSLFFVGDHERGVDLPYSPGFKADARYCN